MLGLAAMKATLQEYVIILFMFYLKRKNTCRKEINIYFGAER